jgi:hypothetical protein
MFNTGPFLLLRSPFLGLFWCAEKLLASFLKTGQKCHCKILLTGKTSAGRVENLALFYLIFPVISFPFQK